MEIFKERLSFYRKKRGFTGAFLSEKIGKSKNTVSNYETGDSVPNLATFLKLCKVLEVTPNDLLWKVDVNSIMKKYINGSAIAESNDIEYLRRCIEELEKDNIALNQEIIRQKDAVEYVRRRLGFKEPQ